MDPPPTHPSIEDVVELSQNTFKEYRMIVKHFKSDAAMKQALPAVGTALQDLRGRLESIYDSDDIYARLGGVEINGVSFFQALFNDLHIVGGRFQVVRSGEVTLGVSDLDGYAQNLTSYGDLVQMVITKNIGDMTEDIRTKVSLLEVPIAEIGAKVSRIGDPSQDDLDRRLDRLDPLLSAQHNAQAAPKPCLTGTRERVISTILDWAKIPAQRSDATVFWMHGAAGAGKTAIAQSIAYEAEKEKFLLASFLFSRTAGGCDYKKLIPTIMYQVAYFDTDFKHRIARAIQAHLGIWARKTDDQIEMLVKMPFTNAASEPLDGPALVVIDALDTCNQINDRQVAEFIRLFICALQSLPNRPKLLITSRSTPGIQRMFCDPNFPSHRTFVLERDIDEHQHQADLSLYIRQKLSVEDNVTSDKWNAERFPSDSQVQRTVGLSGCSFEYAATLVQYVNHFDSLQDRSRELDNVISKKLNMSELIGAIKVKQLEASAEHSDNRSNQAIGDNFPQLPCVQEARLDAQGKRETGAKECLPGTRVKVLEDIRHWIFVQTNAPRVFWLNGVAGSGKSTIARTVAEEALHGGYLGACFFFSRLVGGSAQAPGLVFPEIAHQLAAQYPNYQESLRKTLEDHPNCVNASISEQFSKLIAGPLNAINNDHQRMLLVLDAMDECLDVTKTKDILRLLIEHATRVRFHLRVLITSRPEHHIRWVMGRSDKQQCVLHDMDLNIVQNDILLYLRSELKMIADNFEVASPPPWPSEHALNSLTSKAANLFVYAATAIRFIGNTEAHDPPKQLDIMLGVDSSNNEVQYSQLDELYLHVLNSALPAGSSRHEISRFQWVLGCLVRMRETVTKNMVAAITGYSVEQISQTLRDLHSVILSSRDPSEPIRIYHPSFADFIQSTSRCKDTHFLVSAELIERKLGLRCLEALTNDQWLRRDILQLRVPSKLNQHICHLQDKVKAILLPQAIYACRYWMSHLVSTRTEDVLLEDILFKEFLSRTFLYWCEAMSYLGEVSLAVTGIEDVLHWAKQQKMSFQTITMVYDCYRFLLSFHIVIANSALQVYHTALPFTPRDTTLYKIYSSESHSTIHAIQGVRRTWGACTMSLPSGGAVSALAVSPDGGRLLAIGVRNSISIWDSRSVSRNLTLPELGYVICLSFSPDSSLLASSSSKSSCIKLWDTFLGTNTVTCEGHTKSVLDMSFSPSGDRLASIGHDKTLRIWDTTDGKCLYEQPCVVSAYTCIKYANDSRLLWGTENGTLYSSDVQIPHPGHRGNHRYHAHKDAITCIAISSKFGGVCFATGSKDMTVRLWFQEGSDASGSFVPINPFHCEDHIRSLSFREDGVQLACAFDTTIVLWDIVEGTMPTWTDPYPKRVLGRHASLVAGIAFSTVGSCLFTGSQDDTFKAWDTSTSYPSDEVVGHESWVYCMAISPDNSCLATGGQDCQIMIWNLNTGSHLRTLTGHSHSIHKLIFSLDGTLLASGSDDLTARIWEVESGTLLRTLPPHNTRVECLGFSAEISNVATQSGHVMRFWNLTTPNIPANHEETDGRIGGYADGYGVGLDRGRWLRLWEVQNDAAYPLYAAYLLDDFRVTGFAMRGNQLVFICASGQVLIMDISRLKQLPCFDQ